MTSRVRNRTAASSAEQVPWRLKGPGILILTRSNTFSGGTTISAGTLQLGTGANGQDGSVPGASFGSGQYIVDNGTLLFNYFGNQVYSGLISGSVR